MPLIKMVFIVHRSWVSRALIIIYNQIYHGLQKPVRTIVAQHAGLNLSHRFWRMLKEFSCLVPCSFLHFLGGSVQNIKTLTKWWMPSGKIAIAGTVKLFQRGNKQLLHSEFIANTFTSLENEPKLSKYKTARTMLAYKCCRATRRHRYLSCGWPTSENSLLFQATDINWMETTYFVTRQWL